MGQMAVWMDGQEARVFHVGAAGFDEATVHSPQHHVHRHPMDQETRIRNHPEDEHRFFRDVARALDGEGPILVVGPSVTKVHFLRFAQKHDPALDARIVGLETADHPTDRQIAAHVRSYFLGASPPGR